MILRIGSRRRCVLFAALAASAAAGCGSSNGLVPVTGQVKCNGNPATGAKLHFHRLDTPPGAQPGPIPSAIVDDQGVFSVMTGDLGDGAPAGRYAVLVDWPGEPGERRPATPTRPGIEPGSKLNRTPVDRLQGRYLDLGSPRIIAEIKDDSRELPPFELTN